MNSFVTGSEYFDNMLFLTLYVLEMVSKALVMLEEKKTQTNFLPMIQKPPKIARLTSYLFCPSLLFCFVLCPVIALII